MNNKLRDLFQQPFDLVTYRSVILSQLLHAQRLLTSPEMLEQYDNGDQLFGLGYLTDNEGKEIGLYYTHVPNGDVRRKRVGFRKMLHPYVKYGVDAAIAVFDDGEYWRLSYICDLKGGVTSAKRFSYVFGDPKGQYNTPVGRLTDLAKKRLTLDELHKTFSVDALSKEFFDEYHRHYDRIIAELSRQGNTGAVFHDYVKKMMGRIVFLHFLQKKRWLNDDPEFLSKLFFLSPYKQDFLDQELEPLFFGIFNTEPDKREQLFHQEHWDLWWLAEWEKLPYLNGGLFERDEVDKMKIKLPASLFEQLFEFMASYNFTIDENDPDDADIGIDPEMLGKIFESLLEDNKAKGAFYTPKEIVRYMCKESLIAYLETKVSDNASEMLDIKQSIRTFVEHHELPEELEPYREVLDTALRNVKICDPAIGSGAFPMGLLNELWRCREAIENVPDESNLAYRAELKKEIIENNIYGVDIERGAIDIARLRFWLSIVVDAEKPEPLPNFDYKFMQGNSLIESFEGHDLCHIMDRKIERNGKTYYQSKIGGKETVQVSMDFFSNDTRQNLRIWLKRYFSLTDHKEKIEYRKRINESVKSYIIQQGIGPSAESKLDSLDPSANQDFFLWHTWFKDIFDKGGFDIVIGNPPYVVVEANGKYGDYETESCYDLYAYFFERAVKLLNSNGILSFITSSLYVKGLKYTSLRSFLQNNTSLIAFRIEGDDVFKNAGIPTATFIAKKTKGLWRFEDLYMDKSLTEKIRKGTMPLSSVSSIMRGFEIGRNMVDTSGQYKFLTGSDVSKYCYNKLSYISQSVLTAFSKDIKYFSKERILLRETGSFLTAVYVGNETIYSNRSLYSILITDKTLSTKYVLALLNSSLLQWYYSNMFKGDTELFPKIRIAQAKQLPIRKVSIEMQQPIIMLIDKILASKQSCPNADTSDIEHKINELVYQLYNLTSEEIAEVEQ